jgi:hypothetical protein
MDRKRVTDNTKVWMHGLGAAFIGAAASSLGAIMVAPDRFNLNSLMGLRNVVLASVFSGVSSAAAYLKASPLPPLNQVVEDKHTEISEGNTKAVIDAKTTTTGPA